ncbi:phosphatidate cytidylyltransferase [Helicobacter cappadocius]|uniref:Phosphatidate cytidylyltransferase n=1 Tax=Helicobacter cappadocius TaxID=3063998 RepID=A0AA90T999_9HELI|nr:MULTISPECIES: phosphatidate cytidylyltransferase [unclassified Helicobacter]MDO7252774.1 phosphatidate cytidylyltransferase [Helicobacter sp. faydin-H75]MDP2538642.1 phosphatidate cytidylyltransferase [Helicobacter sp. faydin-H76]
MNFKDFFSNSFSKEKQRYITGLIIIAALVLIFWINEIILVWAVLGAAYLIGFSESIKLFGCKSHFMMYVLAILVWIFAGLNGRPIESSIFVAMLMAGYLGYRKSFEPKQILPFIYPSIPFLVLFAVYKDFGVRAIIWLVVVVALTDIGAYFGGKAFGRTPFSPTSPNKTLEGAIIGLAVAVAVGSFFGIGVGGNFIVGIVFSFAISISAILGDLYESYLKRNANLKDSGRILPGHGGILDRLDAILFGAIMMHFLLYFLEMWKESSIIMI